MRLLLFLGLTVALLNSSFAQSTYFHNEYPSVWQRSAEYTLEVAEAMPESKYHFKPTDVNMSFREQMIHIANNLAMLSSQVTGERPDFLEGQNPDEMNKAQVRETLKSAFDHVADLIQNMDNETLKEQITFAGEKMSKENVFYLMRDHMAHHRGQVILYLRMNDIAAPRYRGW